MVAALQCVTATMTSISTTLAPNGFHPISRTVVALGNGIRHARRPALGVAPDERGRPAAQVESRALVPCTLHLAFDLPVGLFVDPDELALREGAYTHRIWGSRDVEKPAHAVSEGQAVLLNVYVRPEAREVGVEVPLHLRYARPRESEEGYDEVKMKVPVGFWACPSFGGQCSEVINHSLIRCS
jgi:hypothetical protein